MAEFRWPKSFGAPLQNSPSSSSGRKQSKVTVSIGAASRQGVVADRVSSVVEAAANALYQGKNDWSQLRVRHDTGLRRSAGTPEAKA
jgi:hypothetical protein